MTLKKGRPFKGSEPLTKRLGFRIPNDMLDEMSDICGDQDITKTDFILRAIENQLQKEVMNCLTRSEKEGDAYVL